MNIAILPCWIFYIMCWDFK